MRHCISLVGVIGLNDRRRIAVAAQCLHGRAVAGLFGTRGCIENEIDRRTTSEVGKIDEWLPDCLIA